MANYIVLFKLYWKTFSAPNASYSQKYLSQSKLNNYKKTYPKTLYLYIVHDNFGDLDDLFCVIKLCFALQMLDYLLKLKAISILMSDNQIIIHA